MAKRQPRRDPGLPCRGRRGTGPLRVGRSPGEAVRRGRRRRPGHAHQRHRRSNTAARWYSSIRRDAAVRAGRGDPADRRRRGTGRIGGENDPPTRQLARFVIRGRAPAGDRDGRAGHLPSGPVSCAAATTSCSSGPGYGAAVASRSPVEDFATSTRMCGSRTASSTATCRSSGLRLHRRGRPGERRRPVVACCGAGHPRAGSRWNTHEPSPMTPPSPGRVGTPRAASYEIVWRPTTEPAWTHRHPRWEGRHGHRRPVQGQRCVRGPRDRPSGPPQPGGVPAAAAAPDLGLQTRPFSAVFAGTTRACNHASKKTERSWPLTEAARASKSATEPLP